MAPFHIILQQLISFFLMMLTGYLASCFKVLTKDFLDGLSRLIMRVLLPVLIFANAMNGTNRAQLASDIPILLLSLSMYLALILVFFLTARVLRLPGERGRIFQAAMIFGNAGFIGIPLILALYPDEGAIYIALMSIIDQGLLWTYGVYLTTPKGEGASFHLRSFVNPALCAVLLSVVFLLLEISIPDVIEQPLLTIGKSSTPLSLIYLGGLLYFCDWKQTARQKELYIGILIKMILFPVAFFAAASLLFADMNMVYTTSLVSALPTMTTIAMFAQSRGKDGDYALGLVLLTTAASLITLTLVSWIIFR